MNILDGKQFITDYETGSYSHIPKAILLNQLEKEIRNVSVGVYSLSSAEQVKQKITEYEEAIQFLKDGNELQDGNEPKPASKKK